MARDTYKVGPLPTSLEDDPPAWSAHWRREARRAGFEPDPAGEPTIEKLSEVVGLADPESGVQREPMTGCFVTGPVLTSPLRDRRCTFIDKATERRCIKEGAHLTGHLFKYRTLTEADKQAITRMVDQRAKSKRQAPYIAAVIIAVLIFHEPIGHLLTAIGGALANG